MIRQPAVAGRFYPSDKGELARQVESFLAAPAAPEKPARRRAIACMLPHAGYMYSGHVAGAVLAAVDLPRRFIILCPRHTREGQPLAILGDGAWRTPLGDAPIDAELAAALRRACPMLQEDAAAHRFEHAIEVEIPFLQHAAPGFRFVPIVLGVDRFPILEELAGAMARVLRDAATRGEPPVMLIASSDMNHYEPDDVTRSKDARAIERLLALDGRGLHETVRREGITMCGYAPATVMLLAAKALGATRAELIRYATSGDINGDRDEVVGYAGIVIE